MNKASTERLHDDDPDHFRVEDGHTMGMMKDWPQQGHGKSGSGQSGTLQASQTFTSNEPGFAGRGIGEMPFREVGDMAMSDYGKDLSPDARNSLGPLDASSDSLDTRRLLPRNASDVL